MSYWREKSARIVYETLKRTEGQSDSEIRKALKEAYPFGERSMHPYKVWLDEIRRQTRGRLNRSRSEPVLPLMIETKKGEDDATK